MKIAVISNDTSSLVNFRYDMLLDFLSKGHQLVLFVPDHERMDELTKLQNVTCVELAYDRTGTNPIHDMKLIRIYKQHLNREKPDIVFAYNLKPVVYGIYAAHKQKIHRAYAMIPGAGFVFSGENLKAKGIRFLIGNMYRKSLSFCEKVFFQNPDDLNEFVENKLVKRAQAVQIYGSGVNLQKFLPKPLPDRPVFLFSARLLKVKGIMEYCEAAQRIRQKHPEIEFHVVGGCDENPTSIAKADLERYIQNKAIIYHGKVKDVRPYIERCSVFVLPSYHREGVPHAVLEAMAMGRPILTTHAIGCRETVKEGINGFMVDPKNIDALEEKMLWFIRHYDRAAQMGKESVAYCKEKFDVEQVNRIIMEQMGL